MNAPPTDSGSDQDTIAAHPRPTGDAAPRLAGPCDADTSMAMLSSAEREASSKLGSMLFSKPAPQKTREPRVLYRKPRADGALLRSKPRRELTQVLPGSERLVLVGTPPTPAGKVPEPVALVVDNRRGSHHTRSLQP